MRSNLRTGAVALLIMSGSLQATAEDARGQWARAGRPACWGLTSSPVDRPAMVGIGSAKGAPLRPVGMREEHAAACIVEHIAYPSLQAHVGSQPPAISLQHSPASCPSLALSEVRAGACPTSDGDDSTSGGHVRHSWFSLSAGMHTENTLDESIHFAAGLSLGLSLVLPMSDRIDFEVFASYWEAQATPRSGLDYREPNATVTGKNAGVALGYVIHRSEEWSVSIGPSLGIGGGSNSEGVVFVARLSSTAALPIIAEWLRLAATVGYESGMEYDVGGGFRYGFLYAQLGVSFRLPRPTGGRIE
jgi:hypothetical protein